MELQLLEALDPGSCFSPAPATFATSKRDDDAIRNVRPLNFVAVFVDTELQAEVLIHFCCSYFFSVFEAVAFAAVWSTLLFFRRFRPL